MAKAIHIEERTDNFIKEYNRLKGNGEMVPHIKLKEILGVNAVSTISEILGRRQNISADSWKQFKKHFGISDSSETNIIRMSEEINKLFGEHEERLLRIEAHLEVYENAIAGLLSESKNDFLKKVGELREAVQAAVNRRFDKLSKKHGH